MAQKAKKRAVKKSPVKRAVKKAAAKPKARPKSKPKARPKSKPRSKQALKPKPKRSSPRRTIVKTPNPNVSARLSGATVDDYITSVPAPFKAVLAELKQVVMTAAPEAHCSIKWGQPVFELNGPFAWMKAYPSHANLGFWRGADLPDPDGILQGTGNRMRHVKIVVPEHIPVSGVDALVRAAVALNRAKGDPTQRGTR